MGLFDDIEEIEEEMEPTPTERVPTLPKIDPEAVETGPPPKKARPLPAGKLAILKDPSKIRSLLLQHVRTAARSPSRTELRKKIAEAAGTSVKKVQDVTDTEIEMLVAAGKIVPIKVGPGHRYAIPSDPTFEPPLPEEEEPSLTEMAEMLEEEPEEEPESTVVAPPVKIDLSGRMTEEKLKDAIEKTALPKVREILAEAGEHGLQGSQVSPKVWKWMREQVSNAGGVIPRGVAPEVKKWIHKVWLREEAAAGNIVSLDGRYQYLSAELSDEPEVEEAVEEYETGEERQLQVVNGKVFEVIYEGRKLAGHRELSEEEIGAIGITEEMLEFFDEHSDDKLRQMLEVPEQTEAERVAILSVLDARKFAGVEVDEPPELEREPEGEESEKDEAVVVEAVEGTPIEEVITAILKESPDKNFRFNEVWESLYQSANESHNLTRKSARSILHIKLPILERSGFVEKIVPKSGKPRWQFSKEFDAEAMDEQFADLQELRQMAQSDWDLGEIEEVVQWEIDMGRLVEMLSGEIEQERATFNKLSEDIAIAESGPSLSEDEEIELNKLRIDLGAIQDRLRELITEKTELIGRQQEYLNDIVESRVSEARDKIREFQDIEAERKLKKKEKKDLNNWIKRLNEWTARRRELQSDEALKELIRKYGEREPGQWAINAANKILKRVALQPENLDVAMRDPMQFRRLRHDLEELRNLGAVAQWMAVRDDDEEAQSIVNQLNEGIEVGLYPITDEEGEPGLVGKNLRLGAAIEYAGGSMPKDIVGYEDEEGRVLNDEIDDDLRLIVKGLRTGKVGKMGEGITPQQLINLFNNYVKGNYYYNTIFGKDIHADWQPEKGRRAMRPLWRDAFKKMDPEDPDLANLMEAVARRVGGEELAEIQREWWVEQGAAPVGYLAAKQRADQQQLMEAAEETGIPERVRDVVASLAGMDEPTMEALLEMRDEINIALRGATPEVLRKVQQDQKLVNEAIALVNRQYAQSPQTRREILKEMLTTGENPPLTHQEFEDLFKVEGIESMQVRFKGDEKPTVLEPRDYVRYWNEQIKKRKEAFRRSKMRYRQGAKLTSMKKKLADLQERKEEIEKIEDGRKRGGLTRSNNLAIEKLEEEIEFLEDWPQSEIKKLEAERKGLRETLQVMKQIEEQEEGTIERRQVDEAEEKLADVRREIETLREIKKAPEDAMPVTFEMIPDLESMVEQYRADPKLDDEEKKRIAVAIMMAAATNLGRYHQVYDLAEALHMSNVHQLHDIRRQAIAGMEPKARDAFLKVVNPLIRKYERAEETEKAEIPEDLEPFFEPATHFPLLPRHAEGDRAGQSRALARFIGAGLKRGEIEEWSAPTLIQFIGDDWKMCVLNEDLAAQDWDKALERSASDNELRAWGTLMKYAKHKKGKDKTRIYIDNVNLVTEPIKALMKVPPEEMEEIIKWMGMPKQGEGYAALNRQAKQRFLKKFLPKFESSPFFLAERFNRALENCAIDKARTIQGRMLAEKDPDAILSTLKAALPTPSEEQLQTQIEAMRAEQIKLEEAMKEAMAAEFENDELKEEIVALQQEIAGCEDELETVKGALGEAMEAGEQWEERAKVLEQQEKVEAKKEKAEKKLAEKAPEVATLQRQLSAAKGQITKLKKKLETEPGERMGTCFTPDSMNTLVDSLMVRRRLESEQVGKYEKMVDESEDTPVAQERFEKQLGALRARAKQVDSLIKFINDEGIDAFVC